MSVQWGKGPTVEEREVANSPSNDQDRNRAGLGLWLAALMVTLLYVVVLRIGSWMRVHTPNADSPQTEEANLAPVTKGMPLPIDAGR